MRAAVAAENSLDVDIVEATPAWRSYHQALSQALAAAAAAEDVAGSVSLLLSDDAELARLNQQFRGKQGPTNVLSFAPAPGAGEAERFFGDIALASETIVREAEIQGKSVEHHAIHMAVHGFLHLLGYDHQNPSDAEAMEARERAILASLGIGDPYA